MVNGSRVRRAAVNVAVASCSLTPKLLYASPRACRLPLPTIFSYRSSSPDRNHAATARSPSGFARSATSFGRVSIEPALQV